MITDSNGFEVRIEKSARDVYRFLDREIVGMLETRLGRVPSNDEVKAKGRKLVHPNGDWTFQWEGKPFAYVERHPDQLKIYRR